jgi:hypothetical protein
VPTNAPATVCCPKCWTWSELKKSTTCKRCGTPLVLQDGRQVNQLADPSVAAAPAYAFNARPVSLTMPMTGTDWISIARWMTIGYGLLTVIGLIAVGLLIPTLTIPVQDPNTGQIIDETLNIRPFLAVVAVVALIVYGIIAWLIGYGVARGILLALTVLAIFATLSRLGSESSVALVGSLFSLLVDFALGFVLTMTFVAPRRALQPAAFPLPPPLPPPSPAQ